MFGLIHRAAGICRQTKFTLPFRRNNRKGEGERSKQFLLLGTFGIADIAQDWIVETIAWDTANRRFWLAGHHLDGKPFMWGHYPDKVFDWRYDLTNARYEIGRHETETEARKRERQTA